MTTILVGPGPNQLGTSRLVSTKMVPETGTLIRLAEGMYKLTDCGMKEWGKGMCNYFTYERVGNLPDGAELLLAEPLTA